MENIKKLRKEFGLSSNEMAKMIGCSQATYYNAENNRDSINETTKRLLEIKSLKALLNRVQKLKKLEDMLKEEIQKCEKDFFKD